jgi:adenosylhomocysteine nucleosidase
VSNRTGTSPPIVAVTGLVGEARIASGPGVHAIACGGDASAVTLALEREIERGARAVISFGIAGALADDVPCGTWLVARSIFASDGWWPCDVEWVARMKDRLPGAMIADLAGVDTPVMAAAAKRALHRSSRAVAVDTESHFAARIAATHRLPFAAFRVVADAARRDLPPVASVALAPNGRIRGGAVLRSLARTPAQIPLLLRTAADTRAALRALSRGRRFLGPGLAFPHLDELLLDMT